MKLTKEQIEDWREIFRTIYALPEAQQELQVICDLALAGLKAQEREQPQPPKEAA